MGSSKKIVFGVYLMVAGITLIVAFEDTIRSEIPHARTAKEYYGSDLVLSCGNESEIAISSFRNGFKPMSNECARDLEGDCLQESPTESRFTDDASGRRNAIFPTCSVTPVSGGKCDKPSLYIPFSFYSRLEYLCIPKTRVAEMCDVMYRTSPTGVPVYLQNRDYSSGTSIMSSDKECSCSVEVLSPDPGLVVYTLHQELAGTSGTCHQSVNMTDGEGTVLNSVRCEPPIYNRITKKQLDTNFITVTLSNANSENTGKFWFGFEASDGKSKVRLECPAVKKTDCGHLENPENGTVSTGCTSFGCTALYTCSKGFSIETGSVTRTCLENNIWSGTPAVCTPSADPCTSSASQRQTPLSVNVVLGVVLIQTIRMWA